MQLRSKVTCLVIVTWALILSIMAIAAGLDGIKVYEILLCIVTFFISISFWFLLDKFVLKRINHLTQQVIELGKEGKFDAHILLHGKDELSIMANEINAMLILLRRAHSKELEYNKQQLEEVLHYDRVTALPSRFFFNRYINERLEKKSSSTVVGIFSVSNFKRVSDALGQKVGDEALKQIAVALKEKLSEGDVLARYSQSEFSFCLHDFDAKKALLFSEELLRTLSKPILLQDQKVYFKANVALTPLQSGRGDVLLVQHQLTLALSRANTLGFNQVVLYESTMESDEDRRRLILGSDLHHAIDNKELFLLYQPKISFSDYCIEGVEALVRWQHPIHGLISPAEFIPLAESLGLIGRVSTWVMREVCKACARLKTSAGEPLSVAINISPIHFHQEHFVDELMSIVDEYTMLPAHIELELTEGSIMGDVDFSVKRLKQLGALGFRIAIDDFGTGYSSLRYLKNFPVHSLKIDKSFVDEVPSNQNNVAIIRAIISLAKSLSLRIIAEGAETSAQLDFLAAEDVDIVQGYVFSCPIGLVDLGSLLARFSSPETEKAYWQGTSHSLAGKG